MKRILLSLAGGIIIPILLVSLAWLLLDIFDMQGPGWFGELLFTPITWPLTLLGPFFPKSDNPAPYTPMARITLFLLAMLLNILLYSSLTYIVISWRARHRRLP